MKIPRETYLYFRGVANEAADDDGTAGSLLMPLSKLKGMAMGTGAITGALTDDEDAFTLFFEPAGIGEGDGDIDAGDNDVDAVIIATTSNNTVTINAGDSLKVNVLIQLRISGLDSAIVKIAKTELPINLDPIAFPSDIEIYGDIEI